MACMAVRRYARCRILNWVDGPESPIGTTEHTQRPETMTEPKYFGRYKVSKVLGKGAMGLVYLAEDPLISRQVAIKVIEAQAGVSTDELLARFDREFRSAGTLSHPNVVTVYDVGKQDDTNFIALEYVDGQTLQEMLESQRILALDHVGDLISQICDALDFAHDRGIVHRDVKPQNILMTAKGRPKITDFGIAKFTTGTTAVTQEGAVVGTPAHMSPEQAHGHPLTGASDQFSVGVILYRMLTGELPFAGETPTTIMYRIVHEQPLPVNTLNPSIPPALNDVVMTALSKDPSQRYRSCTALAEAVHAVVSRARSAGTVAVESTLPDDETTREAVPVARRRWPWRIIASSGVAALVLVAAGIWLGGGSGPNASDPPDAGGLQDTSGLAGTGVLDETELAPAAAAAVPDDITRRVRVESDLAGAAIWLDGTDLATVTPAEIEIEGSAGQMVRLELRRDGTITAETDLTLGPEMLAAWVPEETVAPEAVAVAPEQYRIGTTPSGARVILNGAVLDGVTPLFLEVTPGTPYNIRTELDGYDAAGWAFTLEDLSDAQRASRTLDFPLTASYVPGHLVLVAPYRVTIEVRASGTDSAQPRSYGPSANLEVPLRPGRYDLALSAPSVFFERALTVDVAEGAQREIRVPDAVSVQVAAVPSNCRVTIDGRDVGATPVSVDITLGRHEFEFEWPALGRMVTRTEMISEAQQVVFATAEQP